MHFLFRTLLLLPLLVSNLNAAEEKQKAETKSTSEIKSKTDDKLADKAVPKPLPEMSMGSQKAPVVVIDYSSLTCHHCAEFHTTILPKIEEKYIKPGLVRIVIRDYPSDQISLAAHQLAWCRGELKYLDFLKFLYSKQNTWLMQDDPMAALKTIALQNGITPEQYEACHKNQELLDRIVQGRLDGQKKYNIIATPTIVINAKVYQHALSFDEFEKIVKPLLPQPKAKSKKKS